jgi:hypothetical protein
MRRFVLFLSSFWLVAFAHACGGKGVVDMTGTGATGGAGGTMPGTVGAPCKTNADCASPETCTASVPDGYCTVEVVDGCPADPTAPGVCPAGSACANSIELGGAIGNFCLAICTDTAPCRVNQGYSCSPFADAGVCWQGVAGAPG